MFNGRFALARHQRQSLLAILAATVVAGALAVAAIGPLRAVTEPDTPIPVRLVETTERIAGTDTGRAGASDQQVEARSFEAAEPAEPVRSAADDGRATNRSPASPAATAPTETAPPETPAPTDPPETEPPATDPPETQPPVTSPPETDPTVTVPPTPTPTPPPTTPPPTDPLPTNPPPPSSLPPKTEPPRPTITLPTTTDTAADDDDDD